MKRIIERGELQALAKELGVRPDWHEPDEQEITAVVRGVTFDNAGFWPGAYLAYEEIYVTLYHRYRAVAQINLATLLAWASEEN